MVFGLPGNCLTFLLGHLETSHCFCSVFNLHLKQKDENGLLQGGPLQFSKCAYITPINRCLYPRVTHSFSTIYRGPDLVYTL